MQLTCPKCQAAIPPANINIGAALANCPACGEVFGFAQQVPNAAPAGWGIADATAPPELPKPEVAMPRSFHLRQEYDTLVITRDWLTWTAIPILLFCCVWDGFLIFWYSIGIANNAPLMMFLFPLIHVAVGVALTYTGLAHLFNHTDIRISAQTLSVRHYPLPWGGNRDIPVSTIEQLFCAQKYSRTRSGTSITYTVNVIFHGGERLELLPGLEQPAHARFIEQEVELRLGLQDRPVAGEMPSPV